MSSKYIRLNVDKSADAPTAGEFFQLTRLATKKEKYTVLALLLIGAIAITLSIIFISQSFLVTVPSAGGELHEGIIGVPRFNNPLLATSDSDRDLVALVYSGLLRSDESKGFVPDLAKEYSVSSDGLQYTFTIRPDALWHDGVSVTAKDVVFTVLLAQDNLIKSPKRANWDGVKVEAVDDQTVRFTLSKPYAPFLENATLGILPEHIWNAVTPEEFALSVHNQNAIGSGPYKILEIKNDSAGIPNEIDLVANSDFVLGKPFITNIKLHFYQNEDKLLAAFKSGEVKSASGISSEYASAQEKAGTTIISAPLYRVFGIFINTNQTGILSDAKIRKALDIAAPRTEIVNLALHGFGSLRSSPFGMRAEESGETLDDKLTRAASILDEDGWKMDEATGIRSKKDKNLEITLSTSDSPELKTAATVLADTWKKLGVNVVVKVYEPSDLTTNIIRPRKFDALLYGEVMGHFPDPYAFWHSSQRLDPGLNISSYTNPIADKALTIAREEADLAVRKEQYKILEKELATDLPAIFLYAPHYIYLPQQGVQGVTIHSVSTASDRFLNINHWFIETDKVWTIFAKPQS